MIHRSLLIASLALVLSACGDIKTGNKALTPEEAIAKRSVERWQHIINGDFKSAYAYLTPGSRKVMAYEEYAMRLAQAQIKWTDAHVNNVVCEDAETCRAEVELDIIVIVPGTSIGGGRIASKTVLQENWLASGGKWYFLPSQAR